MRALSAGIRAAIGRAGEAIILTSPAIGHDGPGGLAQRRLAELTAREVRVLRGTGLDTRSVDETARGQGVGASQAPRRAGVIRAAQTIITALEGDPNEASLGRLATADFDRGAVDAAPTGVFSKLGAHILAQGLVLLRTLNDTDPGDLVTRLS